MINAVIRPAIREDLPSVYAMFQEFAIFQKTPEKLHITLDELLAGEDHFKCLVASAEGQIVGFATWFFAYYSWTGRGVYLDDLYVRESHRKYGIGGQLLDAVIGIAKENNCRTVRWLVSRWNTNAIEFYRRLGAQVDDTEMTAVLPV
jgi:diamine N-acetyltransferase